jgi:parallel beta-helix repeat protein
MGAKKGSLIIVLLVVTSAFYTTLTIVTESARGATLYVGGGGLGNFSTIQSAILAANPGDTIFVYNGTYNEVISVTETVSLIGESRDNTTIEGDGTGDLIYVLADYVNISGFTITSLPAQPGGIGVYIYSSAENCHIANNSITNHVVGMYVGSRFNTIVNNTISYNEKGIRLWGGNNQVANNTISFNQVYGMEDDSGLSIIENNNINFNDVFGIFFAFSHGDTVRGNEISNNGEHGIYGDPLYDAKILNNTFSENGYGIYLSRSVRITISNNSMTRNGLFIGGYDLGHWNTHSIDTSNTLNGKPIYYWKSRTSGTVPLGAGQVILANCSNVLVLNQDVSKGTVGIILGHSFSNTIENVTTNSNTGYGFYLYKSTSNVVINSTAQLNTRGAYLVLASGNYVMNSSFSNNDEGISLAYSGSNIFSNDTVMRNKGDGFRLADSSGNNISDSSLSENGKFGISMSDCDGTTILNNSVLSNSYHGIFSYRSTNSKIVRNNVSFNTWKGIYLDYSDDSTLEGNTVFGNNHDGVDTYGQGIIINGNNISHNKWSGITGRAEVVTNNTASWNGQSGFRVGASYLANNTAYSNTLDGFYSGDNGYYENNTAYFNKESGFQVRFDDSVFINNHASNNQKGFYLYGARGSRIVGNTVSNNVLGVFLYTSSWNEVVGNIINNNTGDGISLYFSGVANQVVNNTINDNDNGIYVDHSRWSAIYDNKVFLNAKKGVVVLLSDGTAADNNTVYDNEYGFLVSGSNEVLVTNNTVYSNNLGIDFAHSDNGIIANNTVRSNTVYGISLQFSEYSKVYHNNIINNTVQAYDDTMYNQWDNGYPSGGNYWSDYRGFDFFTGPAQDIPGSDGIGDTPYVIDPDSRDRYPLVTRIGGSSPKLPMGFQASLSGWNFENITLIWDLSLDDGAGFDSVVGYRLYRNMTFDPMGLGYQLIATVPNGTSSHIDNFTGEGDPNAYFYRLCVVGLDSNMSCVMSQVGKFTRPLSKGSSLVSIPYVQNDERTATVLQTLSFDNAWSYESLSEEWRTYSKSKPYQGDLEQVEHTMGLWANVVEDSNLTIVGMVPMSTSIRLFAGWNLVGFSSLNATYTVGDLKNDTNATRVEGFDPSSSPYFLRLMLDGDALQPGYGYWVRVETDIIWTIDIT